jgi:S-adenosylmethionine:diacylglycerol 3-amino-3-carboxypropyl transferase
MRRATGRETLSGDTAWESGRLRSAKGPQRLLFGRMYEDARIERENFRGKGRVFCIASAGNVAQELALEHEVVACDINPVQLAYAKRRASGAKPETGDADRAMNFVRAFMPVAGWRKESVRAFLALSDVSEQIRFWRRHLDTRRFRTGFDVLMSRSCLRMVYSQRFLAFLPQRFGSVLRKRMERCFSTHANAGNPYARALMLGESEELEQPLARSIRFVEGDAATVLESATPGSYDAFTLSNIMDGAEEGYQRRVWMAVRRAASAGAMVVLRSFREPSAATDTNQAGRDRSILWGTVDVRSVHAPMEGFS